MSWDTAGGERCSSLPHGARAQRPGCSCWRDLITRPALLVNEEHCTDTGKSCQPHSRRAAVMQPSPLLAGLKPGFALW